MKFIEAASGLYIWRPMGVKVDGDNNSSKPISAYAFLNLVSGNKKTLHRKTDNRVREIKRPIHKIRDAWLQQIFQDIREEPLCSNSRLR